LHRSGTTPVARILAAHPEISGLTDTGVSEDEGQHLQTVYPKIRAHGGMGRFANAAAAHLTATSPLVTDENAESLRRAWSRYWDLDKRFLLEKSPSNMIMGGFLQALFPGSALLVVVRHPIAVALAMQKWNPLIVARNGRRRTSLAGLVRHWLRAHELLRQDAHELRRLHVVRYEDLVANRDAEFSRIARFLELSQPIDASSLRTGINNEYQHAWDRLGSRLRTRRIRRTIEQRFGKAVGEYGYDIDDLASAGTPLGAAALFYR
jgi:hypothetical protein